MDPVAPSSKKWSKKDDHLWLLRLLFVDFTQNSIMKATPKIIAMSLVLLMMFQTLLFLQKFNSLYFIKYLSFYGASFFLVAVLLAAPKTSDICRECVNDNFTIWEVKTASFTTKRRIRVEVALTHAAVVVNGVIAIASGVTHMLPLQDDVDLFFPLALFEEFVPQWKTLLSWGFRISFVPVSFLIPAVFYMLIYFTTFVRLELYLLIDFLESLGGIKHQRRVRKKLEIAIKRHVYLCSVVNEFLNKFKSLIFVFNITGAILGISIFIFYFSFQGTFEGRYPRIITLVLSAFFTFCHTIRSGQMLEDVSNELLEALKRSNWYGWDQNNRKSYLIFLTNQRILRINFSELVAINYNMGVGIIKSIYSTVSVMSRLKHLDYSQ